MKNYKNNCESIISKLLLIVLIAAGMAAVTFKAHADSFNATNTYVNGITIVADPTNSIGIQTGSGIKIDNYDRLGFYIKGSNATTTASIFTAKLVRAGTGNTPLVSASSRDYESIPQITITLTTPAAIGVFYLYTNLDSSMVGSANWIGLASVTNGAASASTTGTDIGITKKILPLRFP